MKEAWGARGLRSAAITLALWIPTGLAARPAQAQPGPQVVVTVSPGSELTPEDVRMFNEAWMSEGKRGEALGWAHGAFTVPFEPGAWGTGEHMEAMVRMYDLTHDPAYLAHLRALARVVLDHRDDRRTDRPNVMDAFRGRVMPAWGAHRVSSGYLHHTSVDIAGVYAYPLAAFARIVAEHPSLWTEHGAEAIEFANAVLETLKAFSDELRTDRNDPTASYWAYPRTYRTLLTETRCTRAYNEAKNGVGPDAGWGDLEGLKRNCDTNRALARLPAAHNQNHAFSMAMIETLRVIDSSFYRQRSGGNPLAEWGRTFFPMQIKGVLRWFTRFAQSPDGPAGRLDWHGADGVPSRFVSTEDTSHGELSMRFLGVLHRNADRINRALPPGQAPIDLTGMRRQLRSTFLTKVGRGVDLAHDVAGTFDGDQKRDHFNGTCNGWLDLTGNDARVHEKCREVTTRMVDGAQPYLSIGGHASLLANKPTGPGPTETVVPEVLELKVQEAADAIRRAGLVPDMRGEGTRVKTQSPRAGTVVARGSTVTCQGHGGGPPN
jgi:hypothetical protein